MDYDDDDDNVYKYEMRTLSKVVTLQKQTVVCVLNRNFRG